MLDFERKGGMMGYNSSCIFHGSCLDIFPKIESNSVKLVVTSPPYNIGKAYEKKTSIDSYLDFQEKVIAESVRILQENGSICWQTGNYVEKGEVIPLDVLLYPIFKKLGMKLRNRIIWHFEHGLHCAKRFSGRYETILWFTKSDQYTFNLDPVRIPQKYPNKRHFKGPNQGELSGNPLGKNPGDVWVIPNVKSNHVEKTIHPCQFPVELIERLVLSMTNPGEIVFDPFLGVGTSVVAAELHKRIGIGSEVEQSYVEIGQARLKGAISGSLKTRKMGTPVYDPSDPKKHFTYRKLMEDDTHFLISENSSYLECVK